MVAMERSAGDLEHSRMDVRRVVVCFFFGTVVVVVVACWSPPSVVVMGLTRRPAMEYIVLYNVIIPMQMIVLMMASF